MSEKKEAGLNGLDMQAVIAAWIIANDGCGDRSQVDCSGNGGYFKGTHCPISRCGVSCFLPYELKLARLRDWLASDHQHKAEAAEVEKRKAEPAKKDEPRNICGICRHVPANIIDLGDVQRTVPCEKKGINVPAYFEGCPDFEPRTATDQPRYVFAKNGMDADYAEHEIEPELSDSVPFRAAFFDVLKENRALRNRLNKTSAEYFDLATDALTTKSKLNRHEEMVFQLKKLNARLRYRIHVYKDNLKLAKELCASGQCDAKKDKANLLDKCERFTEQRNRLSIDLIKATRRVKEVERENSILAKRLVDCKANMSGFCVEKDREVDRLRKENAELLSRYEQLQKDSFQRLHEALCKTKVLEKQIDRLIGDQLLMERKMQICISTFR